MGVVLDSLHLAGWCSASSWRWPGPCQACHSAQGSPCCRSPGCLPWIRTHHVRVVTVTMERIDCCRLGTSGEGLRRARACKKGMGP